MIHPAKLISHRDKLTCRRLVLAHERGYANKLEDIDMAHKTRIMYIECKGGDIVGPASIGRVTFSKTGRTLYYKGKEFASLNGQGFKSNYVDVETRILLDIGM